MEHLKKTSRNIQICKHEFFHLAKMEQLQSQADPRILICQIWQ